MARVRVRVVLRLGFGLRFGLKATHRGDGDTNPDYEAG